MKILLLGAPSAIGSRILNEAMARRHDVTAVARHPHSINTPVNLYSITLSERKE
jgi:putative NADH-flavin reductase